MHLWTALIVVVIIVGHTFGTLYAVVVVKR